MVIASRDAPTYVSVRDGRDRMRQPRPLPIFGRKLTLRD
jgi:hypothetical protein